VITEPVLVSRIEDLIVAADGANLLVIGLSDRWRDEGPVRYACRSQRRPLPPHFSSDVERAPPLQAQRRG
jgi:hypothetical protein